MKNETLCLASLSSPMTRVRFGGGDKKNHLYLGLEKSVKNSFYISSNYPKHYFAGTQRVASKPEGNANIFNIMTLQEMEELRMRQLKDVQAVADTVNLGDVLLKSTDPKIITPAIYYFHPDHASTTLSTGLGTSTMISDGSGYAYQMFLNLPFGANERKSHAVFLEVCERSSMAEQRRSGSLNNSYKFNNYGGKSFEKAFDEHTACSAELDPETGLYYYGARYYDPRVSVWLSVDPLTEQTMTPYQYTYQNPLRYIDPIGMSGEDIIIENTKTKTITRVKDGSEDDTWVKDGVTIEKGLSKSQTEGRIAMATYDDSEWKSNEVSIVFSDSKSVYRETVSDYSISVIVDVMNETGENSIQVNSTMRTPEDQARIMYDLVKTGGMAEQKKLYGVNGRAVLDKYPNQQAMVDKINEIGPSKVSNHLGDTSKINVVDISRYVGLKRPRNFAEKLQADKRVQKVLSPWNSKDRAIHTEIPQPK